MTNMNKYNNIRETLVWRKNIDDMNNVIIKLSIVLADV